MSYTPTTWTTGDTITASAMNKIENGIANAGSMAMVIVDFNNGGISGSVGVYVGYAKYISAHSIYSIESPMLEYFSATPRGRMYIPVCIPSTEDDYKAYIFFNDFINDIAGYTITGNISTTKIEGHVRTGSSTWNSESFYGFEVTGDGEIDVYYND